MEKEKTKRDPKYPLIGVSFDKHTLKLYKFVIDQAKLYGTTKAWMAKNLMKKGMESLQKSKKD